MWNWGLLLKKQEMTQIYVDNVLIPITLMEFVPQQIIRFKTVEKDGYLAVLIGVKNQKWEIESIKEFKINEDFLEKYKVWDQLTVDMLENIETVKISSVSKWKWFQWVVKRFWFWGWPATHGSKFHRLPGSIWNRKPRRVNKNHPLPGHMWNKKVTLKNVKIVKIYKDINVVAFKGSIPGARNQLVNVYL